MKKWVKGYENFYQITSSGKLFRFFKLGKSKEIKGYKDKNGYIRITLCKGRKTENFSLHILVATYFVNNPKGYTIVKHLNNNKSDNFKSNLFWTNSNKGEYNLNNISLINSLQNIVIKKESEINFLKKEIDMLGVQLEALVKQIDEYKDKLTSAKYLSSRGYTGFVK